MTTKSVLLYGGPADGMIVSPEFDMGGEIKPYIKVKVVADDTGEQLSNNHLYVLSVRESGPNGEYVYNYETNGIANWT